MAAEIVGRVWHTRRKSRVDLGSRNTGNSAPGLGAGRSGYCVLDESGVNSYFLED